MIVGLKAENGWNLGADEVAAAALEAQVKGGINIVENSGNSGFNREEATKLAQESRAEMKERLSEVYDF